MSKTKVAVIGYGQIGPVHVRAYKKMSDVEIAVVCDQNLERAKQGAEDAGATHFVTDYHEIFKMEDIDIISVCIPTYLHAELTIEAAKAGKNVFCEKPMARSLSDAEAMLSACDKAGVKLGIGFCRRFHNEWLKFAEIIQQGHIGHPVVWRSATAGPGGPNPWFHNHDLGGGPFVDGAIHNYDFSRLLFGRVTRVMSNLKHFHPDRTAFDTGTTILDYENGSQLVMTWSWGLPKGAVGGNLHDAIGPKGSLVFHNPSKDPLEMDTTKFGAIFLNGPGNEVTPFQYERNDMFHDELRYFVDCVKGGEKPKVDGEIGFEALRIALAVLESGQKDKPIRL